MNLKTNLKRIWSVAAVSSFILMIALWFGYDSPNLAITIVALNAVMLAASLPCSIFAVPVIFSAWYFLEMHPTANDGIYLATVVLLILGALQWFWLIHFYYPPEVPFQKLNLT